MSRNSLWRLAGNRPSTAPPPQPASPGKHRQKPEHGACRDEAKLRSALALVSSYGGKSLRLEVTEADAAGGSR